MDATATNREQSIIFPIESCSMLELVVPQAVTSLPKQPDPTDRIFLRIQEAPGALLFI